MLNQTLTTVITTTYFRFFLSLVFFFLCSAFRVDAQVAADDIKDRVDNIRSGYTHVIVQDVNFKDADKFLQVFKENWKLTKGVSYITRSELDKGLVSGDTYFSLTATFYYNHGLSSWYHLQLSMPEPKYKSGDKFKWSQLDGIAVIVLATDKAAIGGEFRGQNADHELTFDFSGEGHLFNWNPAYLKNYLQQISTVISMNKHVDYTKDKIVKEEISALKTKPLYITDESFHSIGMFTGDGKMIDTAGLFKKYPYAHQYVSGEKLSEKILNDKEPFYYILVTRSGNAKIICVLNGITGQVIYSRLHNMTFTLKEKDLKELAKEIDRS